MSEEKKKEEVKTENLESNIQISDDVVAVIAGMAASEVPGVAEMAGGFAGKNYKDRCQHYCRIWSKNTRSCF